MKLLDIQAAIGTAILLLSLPCDAKHGHSHQLSNLDVKRHNHRHMHKTLQASPRAEGIEDGLEKRSGQCAFPFGADGLVAVTPGSQNAGWAMSPDQPCTPGMYCPYACKSSYVGCQWDPSATAYVYPENMVCYSISLERSMADNFSTVVSIAIPTASSANLSPINLIVNQEQVPSACKIPFPKLFHSARRFFQAMRQC